MKELSKTQKVTIAIAIIVIVFLVFFILNVMMKILILVPLISLQMRRRAGIQRCSAPDGR